MLVIWDTTLGNPPCLLFKPENQEDDATLKGMKAAWECYEKLRKEHNYVITKDT